MNETKILMSGIGGQGVQLASKTLAYAAIACGMEAMVFGTFGGSMRGGNTDVDMVISSTPIRTPPVLDEANAALVMHHDGWAHVAERMLPGGVVLVDSSVFRGDWSLASIRVVPLFASTMATELGQPRGGSMVALGGFAAATGLVWLHQAIPTPWTGAGVSTLHYGLWPFVLGDIAKIFAAAAIIDPAAPWGRWVGRAVRR